MASLTLPSFVTLKRKYPTSSDPDKVKQEIGGEAVESWITNTCVIRMSEAFNYCGEARCKIPKSHALLTIAGGDKLRYAIRVQEFVDFLRDNYGPPDVIRTGDKISKRPFLDKTGIIACPSTAGPTPPATSRRGTARRGFMSATTITSRCR
jgi:Type VI secretion system (T6SS), amidase effector protein 4